MIIITWSIRASASEDPVQLTNNSTPNPLSLKSEYVHEVPHRSSVAPYTTQVSSSPTVHSNVVALSLPTEDPLFNNFKYPSVIESVMFASRSIRTSIPVMVARSEIENPKLVNCNISEVSSEVVVKDATVSVSS